MKRSSTFTDLYVRVPRRKRALSEEERSLWESVAKQIKPLRKKPRTAKQAVAAEPRQPGPGPAKAAPRPIAAVPSPKPSKPAVPPLVGLGRRERAKLSRGKSEIDARLDLHGMTQVRAHHALLGFLQRAHHEGLTFVLVITGKGTVGDSERGILRRHVPQWLSQPEFRTLVVGFEQANIGHGGEG